MGTSSHARSDSITVGNQDSMRSTNSSTTRSFCSFVCSTWSRSAACDSDDDDSSTTSTSSSSSSSSSSCCSNGDYEEAMRLPQEDNVSPLSSSKRPKTVQFHTYVTVRPLDYYSSYPESLLKSILYYSKQDIEQFKALKEQEEQEEALRKERERKAAKQRLKQERKKRIAERKALREQQLLGEEGRQPKKSTKRRLERRSLSNRNLLGRFLSAQSAVDRVEEDRGGYSVC